MSTYEAVDAGRGLRDGALERAVGRAATLFDDIAAATCDGEGVTRDPFGPGEQAAHDIVLAEAARLGLEVRLDAALNAWMTWPGERRDLPRILIGSHLDSVPCGGNFDGLAGVLAGLAAIEALKARAPTPRCDVVVLALRGEENAWFGAQHVGSRAILGKLTAERMDTARRLNSARTLRDHMNEAGADTGRIAAGRPLVDIARLAAFLECHIEQGPALVEAGLSVGLVTAIRGNRRCRDMVCRGEYGHSGVVPRAGRRDAVLAVADFAMRLDRHWAEVERAGGDLVATIGQFNTDPAHHGVTVVPGEARFCLDVRSHDRSVLDDTWAFVQRALAAVAKERGVTFEAGPETSDAAVPLDAGLRRLLGQGCAELGIATVELASGAGHDVGDFAAAGVPSALVFIRSENGSHNPAEKMAIGDFAEAVRLLAWAVDRLAFAAPAPGDAIGGGD
jgi:N-carbamoyl-L-amino-acid hydrolase